MGAVGVGKPVRLPFAAWAGPWMVARSVVRDARSILLTVSAGPGMVPRTVPGGPGTLVERIIPMEVTWDQALASDATWGSDRYPTGPLPVDPAPMPRQKRR